MGREEERRRLRRDLHDGLGPALAGVALGVDAARNMLRTDPRAADALLADLKDETLGCVGEVRASSRTCARPRSTNWACSRR